TPLHHFFAWNERRWRPDRRYRPLSQTDRLPEAVTSPLAAAIGNPDIAAHAPVFAALEQAEDKVRGKQHILVIRLSALGDFIQALGPFAAIRRHHAEDSITLLTTRPFAALAQELGYFDAVLVDE